MSKTFRSVKKAKSTKKTAPYKRWKLSSITSRYKEFLNINEWYIETPYKNTMQGNASDAK